MEDYLIKLLDEHVQKFNQLRHAENGFGQFLSVEFFNFVLTNKPLKEIFESRVFYYKNLKANRDFSESESTLILDCQEALQVIIANYSDELNKVLEHPGFIMLYPKKGKLPYADIPQYYTDLSSYKELGDLSLTPQLDDISEFYPTNELISQFKTIFRIVWYTINKLEEAGKDKSRLMPYYIAIRDEFQAYQNALDTKARELKVEEFEDFLIWVNEREYVKQYMTYIYDWDRAYGRERNKTIPGRGALAELFTTIVPELKEELLTRTTATQNTNNLQHNIPTNTNLDPDRLILTLTEEAELLEGEGEEKRVVAKFGSKSTDAYHTVKGILKYQKSTNSELIAEEAILKSVDPGSRSGKKAQGPINFVNQIDAINRKLSKGKSRYRLSRKPKNGRQPVKGLRFVYKPEY